MRTILIVSPNTEDGNLSEAVSNVLTESGFQVLSVQNKEQLAMFKRIGSPQVTILDLGLYGNDLCFQAYSALTDTTFLGLSGGTFDYSIKRSYPDVALLSMPFQLETLIESVESAYNRGGDYELQNT